MMHSILVGAIYAAMVLAPCVIAKFSGAGEADDSGDANVLEEGFI